MLLTIDDLGWTREQAIAIRGIFASIAEDWDDPEMDVYDETPEAMIRAGLEDIKAGRVREFTSVADLLSDESEGG